MRFAYPKKKLEDEPHNPFNKNMQYHVMYEKSEFRCQKDSRDPQKYTYNPSIEEARSRRQCKPIRVQHNIDRQARSLERRSARNRSCMLRSHSFIADDADADEKPPDPTVCMDWNNYHRLNVIHNFIDDLETSYPSLCTSGIIGKSLEGRNLKILKISNSDASNAAVWVDAGIHAREWIGPAVNTFVANYIARNFSSLPEYITNKDWQVEFSNLYPTESTYFLPVMNPDGYEYSHTRDRMWRKNRAWHAGKCVGVDLNRNFSFEFGGKGSSENPNHCFYRGPAPFSEPESAAVRDVISNAGISFKVYITLHSFGEVIIFPFASREELCPDYVRLLQGATRMSKAIYDTNGTTYKVGISKDVMYRASGTSNDWSYGEVGIPYCYLIELRSKKHKFKLPQEEIEETGNEILNCVIALMELVDKYPLERFDKDLKKQQK